MNPNEQLSTAFRVARGITGQWEVLEDGRPEAVARFTAPQAALSYACELAENRQGSLVVVFDQPSRASRRPIAGDGLPRLQPFAGSMGATSLGI